MEHNLCTQLSSTAFLKYLKFYGQGLSNKFEYILNTPDYRLIRSSIQEFVDCEHTYIDNLLVYSNHMLIDEYVYKELVKLFDDLFDTFTGFQIWENIDIFNQILETNLNYFYSEIDKYIDYYLLKN